MPTSELKTWILHQRFIWDCDVKVRRADITSIGYLPEVPWSAITHLGYLQTLLSVPYLLQTSKTEFLGKENIRKSRRTNCLVSSLQQQHVNGLLPLVLGLGTKLNKFVQECVAGILWRYQSVLSYWWIIQSLQYKKVSKSSTIRPCGKICCERTGRLNDFYLMLSEILPKKSKSSRTTWIQCVFVVGLT